MPTYEQLSGRVDEYVERLRHRAAEEIRAEPLGADQAMKCEVAEIELQNAGSALTLPGLIDLVLKDQPRLDRIARDAARQRELIPWYLAIGLLGYTIFGVALALVFSAADAWPALTPMRDFLAGSQQRLIDLAPRGDASPLAPWWNGDALALVAAFDLGLIGAIGVCLPSFYFYGLLAGVSTSMLQVTTHAVKGMAAGAVAVVGVLPIYVAVILGVVVVGAPDWLVHATCLAGLALPFVAGLWGTRALYLGFVSLADTLPPERRARRACFLKRLLFSWSACFTAVTPLMIFTLWEYLSR